MISSEPQTFFDRSRLLRIGTIASLMALGLVVRLINLTNPPLDEGYRYLNSAIIARGMYYQMLPNADLTLRQKAIEMWKAAEAFEPPIFERIVAISYLFTGGEKLWLPRLYSILFWMLGGIGLYRLSCRIFNIDGALTALAFYMVLPIGVIISRRFQPDPFMVMWIIFAALALDYWHERGTWKSGLLAGVICGTAVLIKVFAVFPVAVMAIMVVLASGRGWQRLGKPQVWVTAAVMISIPAIYYLVDTGSRSAGYFLFWNVSFAHLLLKPWFYIRWSELLQNVTGLLVVFIALAGVAIIKPGKRALIIGWWVGYFLFGLAFPWQIHTHDYYSLMLVPLVAMSLAPVAALFFERLAQQASIWQIGFLGVALLALASPAWSVRAKLLDSDQRVNWRAWEKIGKALPQDGTMIALTPDYGVREKYFAWLDVKLWPHSYDYAMAEARSGGQKPDFDEEFADRTQGMTYFLIIDEFELEVQPQLKEKLYANYPIYDQGDGYTLFRLLPK